MTTEWRAAVGLVGRISVWLGMVLVVAGFAKAALLFIQSSRSLETLATIDSATARSFGSGGHVDLSWHDAAGTTYHATGVQVTHGLGRRLQLGSPLSRAQLKIRYQPKTDRPAILVVDDIPERVRSAAALAIAGFLAMSAGSAMILGLMLAGSVGAARSPALGLRPSSLEHDADNRR